MKAGVLAIAAAIASGVSAHQNHAGRRHAHQALHLERNLLLTTGSSPEPTCGCTTIYYTVTGEATLHNPPPPATSAPPPPAPSTTEIATPTTSPAPVVPTPFVQTCSTTGVYTIPATTVTVTSETTVCGATSTHIPAGTHTAGGVTTVVETSTTIVCPYATTTSKPGEVVTSVILTTTYVCPSAGTYTIAPLTTTATESTVWVYPTPATYPAGTYTQNQVVTTVTETDYVFFCPFTSPAPAPAPTYTPAPAPAPVYSTAPVYSAVPEAPKPSASEGSSGGSLPNGQLGSSGDMWGITYTPYDSNGGCKSPEAVLEDIKIIKKKGFTVVRVYATNCGALKSIGDACARDDVKMKMILGVFIEKDTGIDGAQEQVNDIITWKKWNLVELIVVGNEAAMSGAASASALADFIKSAKSRFQAAGYTGPCTTTEPLSEWQANSGLWCDAVDVVGINIHAFFNSQTKAQNAGPFVKGQLDIADGLCPGKYAINLESGWPSSANRCNGLACASPKDQADAMKSIKDTIGGKSVVFSYTDDPWKQPGEWDCEQHWGIGQLF